MYKRCSVGKQKQAWKFLGIPVPKNFHSHFGHTAVRRDGKSQEFPGISNPRNSQNFPIPGISNLIDMHPYRHVTMQ